MDIINDLPIYRLQINEDDNDTGITEVALTNMPAIEMKGFAFESNQEKKLIFEDKSKLRITAPMMLSDTLLFREDGDESYYVIFEQSDAEKMYQKFLKNLRDTNIFNEKHTDTKINGYLFETILLDSQEKLDFYNGLFENRKSSNELKLMSSVMTIQFNDEESYIDALTKDMVGMSLEGMFNLNKLSFNSNKNENGMKEENKELEERINELATMFEAFVSKFEEKEEEKEVEAEEEKEVEAAEEEEEKEVEAEDNGLAELTESLITRLDELANEIAELKANTKVKEEFQSQKEEVIKDLYFNNFKNTLNATIK